MKKAGIGIGLALLAIILVACGSSGTENGSAAGNPSSGEVDPGSAAMAASARDVAGPSQLLFGTLRLENTENAVSSEQAAELLPLWKAYRSLVNSDSAAQAEIDAVIKQLWSIMTEAQVQAIEKQEMDPEDFAEIAEILGADFTDLGNRSEGENLERFQPGPGPGGGEGMMPGQGPGGPGGGFGDLNPDQIATLRAEREAQGGGFGNRMILNLLDPYIEWLEARAEA